MTDSPRICVVGSLNMDFVLRAPRIPVPGETVLGAEQLQTIPGGKGANQAVAAARLGAAVSMIGMVGEDGSGTELLENLRRAGVDTTHVGIQSGSSSGVALIVVDERGQNSIVVSSGANMELAAADVKQAEAAIQSADVLVMQLEVRDEVILEAARIARDANTMVVLNPAPARTLSAELLEAVDYLVPNETETGRLTGIEVHSDRNIAQSVESIRRLGVPTVVITRGSSGATFVTADQIGHVPAYNVEPVDTTACGDAFVAALAVSVGQGNEIAAAVGTANAAGALAATVTGAQPSLPLRDAVDRMLAGPARRVRSSITTTRIDLP